MKKITMVLCLVVVCLLAGVTQTLAGCPNGYSAYGHSCVAECRYAIEPI